MLLEGAHRGVRDSAARPSPLEPSQQPATRIEQRVALRNGAEPGPDQEASPPLSVLHFADVVQRAPRRVDLQRYPAHHSRKRLVKIVARPQPYRAQRELLQRPPAFG